MDRHMFEFFNLQHGYLYHLNFKRQRTWYYAGYKQNKNVQISGDTGLGLYRDTSCSIKKRVKKIGVDMNSKEYSIAIY